MDQLYNIALMHYTNACMGDDYIGEFPSHGPRCRIQSLREDLGTRIITAKLKETMQKRHNS